MAAYTLPKLAAYLISIISISEWDSRKSLTLRVKPWLDIAEKEINFKMITYPPLFYFIISPYMTHVCSRITPYSGIIYLPVVLSSLNFCVVKINPINPAINAGGMLYIKKPQFPVYSDIIRKITGIPTKTNKETINAVFLFSFILLTSLINNYFVPFGSSQNNTVRFFNTGHRSLLKN